MTTSTLTPEHAKRFARCLAGGGVAVFPADTVYGLACDPANQAAVARLYELKGRSPDRPAAVMFFSLDAALVALPELTARERSVLCGLLPGPLTLLLPNRARRYPLACAPGSGTTAMEGAAEAGFGAAAGLDTLGLRVPLLPDRLSPLGAVEAPVMQSSANLSGGREARRLDEVPRALLDGADLVLDGGELPGVASTVLDLREYEAAGRWHVVREGPVGRSELERVLV